MGLFRRHPEWGAQLLRDTTRKRPAILNVILQHHERLDGSGYPNGQRGADSYEALTAGRPYQKPLPPYEALMTIKHETESAGDFDRDVFIAFVQLLGQFNG